MRQLAAWIAVVGVFAALPASSEADPIRVTGGVFDPDFEGYIIHFTGSDFALHHAADPTNLGLFFPSITTSCGPCEPAQQLNETFTTPGEQYLGIGDATIAGTTYRDITFRGTLDFQADPVVLPVGLPDSSLYTAMSTFAFAGAIRGFSAGAELFDVALVGNGRVSTTFFLFNNSFIQEENGGPTFEFQDVAATPEPSTLVLVGLGLAAAARTRRRVADRHFSAAKSAVGALPSRERVRFD